MLTMDDALSGRTFPDAVTPPSEIFNWAGKNLTLQVPYRCFLPKRVNNLLLTGASLSFSYETMFMVMRGFAWCIQTGDIAGHAAAESVAQGSTPINTSGKPPCSERKGYDPAQTHRSEIRKTKIIKSLLLSMTYPFHVGRFRT